jgi:hypothetical protein
MNGVPGTSAVAFKSCWGLPVPGSASKCEAKDAKAGVPEANYALLPAFQAPPAPLIGIGVFTVVGPLATSSKRG